MEYYVLALVFGLILVGAIAMIPVFMVISKIYPFAYANARIRAMRSRLLTQDDFEDLLLKPYNEAIFTLEKKHYPHLSKYLAADFSYASVDKALRSALIEDLKKVLEISPEQSRKFLSAVLMQYDIEDIMTLIRSLNSKMSGDVSERDLVNVTKLFSNEFVDKGDFSLESIHNELKGTSFATVLDKHMDAVRGGDFLAFEIDLKKAYFKRLLSSATSVEAKAYAKKLIDGRNVGLVLKGMDPILEGGRISLESYAGVKGVAGVASLLKDHGYSIDSSIDNANVLEREFFRGMLSWSKGILRKDPLSEASLIGFIALDRSIHRNVNILLKMKHHGFERARIEEVLAL